MISLNHLDKVETYNHSLLGLDDVLYDVEVIEISEGIIAQKIENLTRRCDEFRLCENAITALQTYSNSVSFVFEKFEKLPEVENLSKRLKKVQSKLDNDKKIIYSI